MLVEGSIPPNRPERPKKAWGSEGDRDLLLRVQSPDLAVAAAAHADLFHYCIETITPIIQANVPDENDRKDVAQDTCEFVLRHIDHFEYRDKPLSHWFSAIAKKKSQTCNHRSARHNHRITFSLDQEQEERGFDNRPLGKRLPSELVQDEHTYLPTDLTAIEIDRLVKAVLDELPPAERRIVTLMWFAKITDDREIGRLLHMKPATVRVYLHRARKRLALVTELTQLFNDLFSY